MINEYLYNMLKNEYSNYEEIIKNYKSKMLSIRVNLLKYNTSSFKEYLDNKKINYIIHKDFDYVFLLDNKYSNDIKNSTLFKDGYIYLQNLSSIICISVFPDLTNKDILDMTASPGGKSSLICQLTNNYVNLTGCESNKKRFERLKYNINNLGCKEYLININSLDLDPFLRFDYILLDTPCSGSGTINLDITNEKEMFNKNIFNILNEKQKKLIDKAYNLLKKGGYLLYSTCSIIKCENEDIIKYITNKYKDLKIENIKKRYDVTYLESNINEAIKIMPDNIHEGFFVCLLKKE